MLDSSELSEFADDNFKLVENGRKLSKTVENSVGKGEIARYELFLLFPQCFQRLVLQTRENQGLFWERVNKLNALAHSQIHHFEIFPNLKKLQMITEMWPLEDFKIQIANKTLW